jgi:transaldolase
VKFVLDTANLYAINRSASWRIVDRVTTNPPLIAKEARPVEEEMGVAG